MILAHLVLYNEMCECNHELSVVINNASQPSCGKVMFSVVCVLVCLSPWVPCHQYLWSIGPHNIGTPLTLVPSLCRDFPDSALAFLYRDPLVPASSVQGPPFPSPRPALLVVTSGGQDWRPLQTYSLEDTPANDIWWSKPDLFQLVTARNEVGARLRF